MIGRLLALRRSMLGQMALLTVVFLGWGVYSFVVRPVLDIPVAPPQPVNEATATRVQDAIRAFMIAERDGPKPLHDLAHDPVIRAVQAKNPAFRYYVRIGDRRFGNGSPVYFHALHLDRFERVHLLLPADGLCTTTNRVIDLDHSTGYADFYMCDMLNYFEYRGLVTPVVANTDDLTPLYERWFWTFGNSFLLAAFGVFAIFAAILGVHMLLIRRVAKLAGSFDPERLNSKLPEKGLATEILPLVQAVNHMLDRLTKTHERNRFFLSAAAHEMRTPLTVLRTRLELLDADPLKDKLVEDIRRLTTLVNQLLALMTITNHGEVAGFVDLAECCRMAITDATATAEARGVTISFGTSRDVFEIEGDAALLQSAVLNLVANAVSVSPAGSTVVVTLDDIGGVTVRDRGPGIAAPDPDVLFEPFVRHPPARKGHGLGLAIVKAVAVLHGGRVSAANAPDGGAVFTMGLALLQEA